MRSRRRRPRNISRRKLGRVHSVSRDASATSSASCSVTCTFPAALPCAASCVSLMAAPLGVCGSGTGVPWMAVRRASVALFAAVRQYAACHAGGRCAFKKRADRIGRVKVHLAAIVLLAALTALLVAGARSGLPCTGDEANWIASGYLTLELARTAAPPSRWARAFEERLLGDWGNKNPPVGKLFVGVAAAVARRPGDSMRYAWRWSQSTQENVRRGYAPSPALLAGCRVASALCGGLVLVLIYVLAVQLLGASWLALLAPLVLAATPTFEYQSTHVCTDLPQIALLAGAVVAFVASLRQRRAATVVFALALVLAGLSCATKLNSGALPPALALASLLIAPPAARRRSLGRAALALVAPAVVFVAVDPYLWPAPVARTGELVTAWHDSKRAQQLDPQLAPTAVHTRGDAARLVLVKGVLWPTADGADLTASRAAVWIEGCAVAAALLVLATLRRAVVQPWRRTLARARWRALMIGALATT